MLLTNINIFYESPFHNKVINTDDKNKITAINQYSFENKSRFPTSSFIYSVSVMHASDWKFCQNATEKWKLFSYLSKHSYELNKTSLKFNHDCLTMLFVRYLIFNMKIHIFKWNHNDRENYVYFLSVDMFCTKRPKWLSNLLNSIFSCEGSLLFSFGC